MAEDKEQLCHAEKAFQDAYSKIQLKGQVQYCDYNSLPERTSIQRHEIEVDIEATEATLFFVFFQ